MVLIDKAWAGATALLMDDPLAGGDSVTIPGLARFKGIVSAMVPFALVACVLAVIIGAIIWALAGSPTTRTAPPLARRRSCDRWSPRS